MVSSAENPQEAAVRRLIHRQNGFLTEVGDAFSEQATFYLRNIGCRSTRWIHFCRRDSCERAQGYWAEPCAVGTFSSF
jgi:hypothetical protein